MTVNVNQQNSLTRSAGFTLVACAALAIFFMLHHPSTGAHELAQALDEIRDEGAISAWVHGLLILVMVGIWFGAFGLTRMLGTERELTIVAFLFFSLGTLAYCLAAMVSGFIVPAIGARYAGTPGAEMQQALGMLRVSFISNQAFANAGLVGTSAGIFIWSLELGVHKTAYRWLGFVGALAGLVPLVMMVTGNLTLHLAGMTWVVVAQSAWYAMAGVVMLRHRV
jgi:hypothetical protein